MEKNRSIHGLSPCSLKFFKIMKLTVFLMLISFIGVFASETYSQTTKLSLKVEKISLEEFLIKIEDQSEFRFFYTGKIDVEKKVSGEFKNKKITEILDNIKEEAGIQYEVLGRQIVLSPIDAERTIKSIQQQKNIKGMVTDDDGEPMPGVTVLVKGTTHGTVTDIDGNYFISNLPTDGTIVFSFVGMLTNEIAYSSQTTIDVVMKKDAIGIEEVVAIGYGTVKKQDLTGAVAILKADVISEKAIASVGEALAGQLAGVQAQQVSGKPGSELVIRIRGIGTINASSSPLYIVDGIPIGDNMKDLNPNDIASIEVLKDASSAAIYGARGSNGVILITTKQGKKSKPTFDFVANYGVQTADQYFEMMNTEEFVTYNIWYKNEAHIRKGGSLSDPIASRAAYDQYPDSWNDISSLADINWQDEIYRTAVMQTYHLTASGGNDIGSYLVSASFMNQDGIVKKTGYERTNFRVNTTLNVGENLKLGMNIAPSFSKENNPDSEGKESALHHAINYVPLVPKDMNTEEWGYQPAASGWPNPLQHLKEVHDETRNNKILTNVWGELSIMDALKFKSQYGYNFRETRNSYFRPSNTNNGRADYGTFFANDQYDWSLQNTLNYTTQVSQNLNLNVLLGQSIEGSKYYISSGRASGYPNSMIHTTNVASTAVSSYTEEYESAMSSYFGRMLFSLKDKYLLTMNLRRDGSSNFGVDTKWGWFPSASMGWKISREEFMQNTSDWLDLLKLRVSVGKTGNNGIGYYNSISMLGVTNYNYNGGIVSGLSPSTKGNTELGWETKISKNFGLDLSFLNGRIQANIDYYIDDTKDMLQDVPVSYMTGYNTILQNIGEVQNRGIELEVSSHNMTRDFKWSTSFNFSKNTNEVKRLGNEGAPIIQQSWGFSAFITKEGEAIRSYYMYKTDGLLMPSDFDSNGNALVAVVNGQEEGNLKIVDTSKDGKIDSDDLEIIGNNLPDFNWGLTNRFSYKSFDMNVHFQGSQGGYLFFLGTRHMDNGQWNSAQLKRWVNAYRPETGENTMPETDLDTSWDGKTPSPFGNNPRYNDTWLYDASFIRIKNLTIGYNLPENLCKKMKVEKCRVYIMGDNLHTWDNYPGTSTEVSNYGGAENRDKYPGTDYTTYPISRRYSIGVNLTF